MEPPARSPETQRSSLGSGRVSLGIFWREHSSFSSNHGHLGLSSVTLESQVNCRQWETGSGTSLPCPFSIAEKHLWQPKRVCNQSSRPLRSQRESQVKCPNFHLRAQAKSLKLLDRLSHAKMPSDILRVAVPDAASYVRIHTDVLSCLPGVGHIQTSFAIRAVIKPPDM